MTDGAKIGSGSWWEKESRVLGTGRARRHNVLEVKRGDKSLTAVSKCMANRDSGGECWLNCTYGLLAIQVE